MKNFLLAAALIYSIFCGGCQKEKTSDSEPGTCSENPKTNVPVQLQGNWMYGQFSMTDYWSQDPRDYLGNALSLAIAFKFRPDGTYEQYFTSKVVGPGSTVFQQSVTKGTVVIDETNKTIRTYACSAHYKRTGNGHTLEERDLTKNELTLTTDYTYTSGTEAGGVKALFLKLSGTDSPITFLQKF